MLILIVPLKFNELWRVTIAINIIAGRFTINNIRKYAHIELQLEVHARRTQGAGGL